MAKISYLEIENFKRIGDKQRVDLGHPTMFIGPNNSGKTTVLQALALWFQGLKAWVDAKKDTNPLKRTSVGLNRMAIVSVPVRSIRFFWHKGMIRQGSKPVPLQITVGFATKNGDTPLTMMFRHQGDDLVYCTPSDDSRNQIALLEEAANTPMVLLYPLSGLESEERVSTPVLIRALMGKGQTAQVLRNQCYMLLEKDLEGWGSVKAMMERLFLVELGDPFENRDGSLVLEYKQKGMKAPLELAYAGRGFQHVLLILTFLYLNRGSVLLIDEPDAHLEILRQRQLYIILRDLAREHGSQILIATHSEEFMNLGYESLVLCTEGRFEQITDQNKKKLIRDTLSYFATPHYFKAKEVGHILYVESKTDPDMLRELAKLLRHPVAGLLDDRINLYYTQNPYPREEEGDLEKAEGHFMKNHQKHFFLLRSMIPSLKGLALLDGDNKDKKNSNDGGLETVYWSFYELENAFITPAVMASYFNEKKEDPEKIQAWIDRLVDEGFKEDRGAVEIWNALEGDNKEQYWRQSIKLAKMSLIAEKFFEGIPKHLRLSKGDFYQLVRFAEPKLIPVEVTENLDLLHQLLSSTTPPFN